MTFPKNINGCPEFLCQWVSGISLNIKLARVGVGRPTPKTLGVLNLTSPGIAYPGSSQVYDPLGELVADLGGKEESRLVELDLGRVAEVRNTFPFQADADPFDLFFR